MDRWAPVDAHIAERLLARDADGDASVRGVRAFLDRLAAEGDVTATAIQAVAAKGYDGFALAPALVGAVSRSRSR